MADVFINFRSEDEASAATMIERDLSARFGKEKIFRDSKSIRAGDEFPQRLLSAVRDCRVMIAVIGPQWLTARGADGRNALDNESGWTRRELLEARKQGVRVIPVLIDQDTRLDRDKLPPELSWLADVQYRRLNNREADAGSGVARCRTRRAGAGSARQAAKRAGDHTVFTRPRYVTIHHHGKFFGPVHAGHGNQFNGPTRYIAGREDRL